MRSKTRFTSAILAAALLLSLLAPALAGEAPVSAPAPGETVTQGVYTAKVNLDGLGVTLTGISNALEVQLELPETLGGLPVTALADHCFNGPGAYSMTTVVIPSSVTAIAPSALNGTYLKTVTAFEVAAGNTAFEAADGVLFTLSGDKTLAAYPQAKAGSSYTVPDGVKAIGGWAFFGASNLTEIILPNGLTSIGDSAFAHSGLTGMRFPASVTTIGSGVFESCDSFSEITLAMEVIPEKLFRSSGGLTRLTLENTVTKIGAEAFNNCDSLTQVDIPASVTTIGNSAFGSCNKLSTVTLHEGLNIIGERAFADCGVLTSIELPTTLTDIQNGAFSGAGLTSLTIPASVTAIGTNAFTTNALTQVTLPGTVKSLGTSVFSGNKQLVTATVAEGIATLPDHLFSGCTALTDVSLPESLTSIGSSVFSGCSKLEAIALPQSVTALGTSAFNNSGLKSITLPDNIQTLPNSAFSYCKSLTQVHLPANLKAIDMWAFQQCTALNQIVIPASVTTIASGAFDWCSSLLEVTFEGNAPAANSNPFHQNTGMVFYRQENATGYDKAPWKDLNFKIGPAVELEKKPIAIKLSASLNHSRQDALILWLTADITPRTYDGEVNPIAPSGLLTTHIQVEGLTPEAQPEPIYYQGGNTSTFRTFGYNVEKYQGKTINVYVTMDESIGFLSGTSNTLTGPVLTLAALAWDEYRPFGGSDGAAGFDDQVLVTVDDGEGGLIITALDSRLATAETVTVPAEIENKPVTALGEGLFQNCVNLKSVIIPASVKRLGANCFQGCVNLGEVTFLGSAPALEGGVLPFSSDPIFHIQPGATGFDAAPWTETRREPAELELTAAYAFLNKDDITKDLLLQLTVTFDTKAYQGGLPLVQPDPNKLTVMFGATALHPDTVEGNVLTITLPKGLPGGSLILNYPGDRLFQAAQWYEIVYPPVQPTPVALKSASYVVEAANGGQVLWLTPTFDPAVHPYQSKTPDVSKITLQVDGVEAAVQTDGVRVGTALTTAQAGKTLPVTLTFPGDENFLAAAPLTVQAVIPASSGGSSGGGGSGGGSSGGSNSATKPTEQPAEKPTEQLASVPTVKSAVSAAAAAQAVKAVKAGEPVVLKAEAPTDSSAVAVTVPAAVLASIAESEGEGVSLQTPVADLTLDPKVLELLQGDGKQDMVVSAGSAETAALPQSAQALLSDRPVYDISITAGGKTVSQFGGGTVTVALPYELADGEDESSLAVFWVQDDGSLTPMPYSRWADGKQTFVTSHLSTYAILHRPVSYSDTQTHWADGDIRFTSARGIFEGMGGDRFDPERHVTGAMAVTALGRLAGVEPPRGTQPWFAPYLTWAKEEGLLPAGFNSAAPLPREQLAGLMANYLQFRGLSAPAGTAVPYTDQGEITAAHVAGVEYVRAVGLMQGRNDGSFDPHHAVTRAELAVLFHRLVELEMK